MKNLWNKFDAVMQAWFDRNKPWSIIVMGIAGLVTGSLIVIGAIQLIVLL